MKLHNQPSTFKPDMNKKFEIDWLDFERTSHDQDLLELCQRLGNFNSYSDFKDSLVAGFSSKGNLDVGIFKDEDNDYICVALSLDRWIEGRAVFDNLTDAVLAALLYFITELETLAHDGNEIDPQMLNEASYLRANYP